eukprot:TRINITY_DN5098_c0_g1_i1.p1 TRINITY_DN5098_c0_g1~~TRINITY_DN5098_c0_g1_i1.p1  ORF type:complete len:282 (+),score=45.51 TRINITY_DN5098_c0_g1_i1:81-848(+)
MATMGTGAAPCAVAKKVGHSPALSCSSTTWPPSPLQLESLNSLLGSFSDSRSGSSRPPSPASSAALEEVPQLPALSASSVPASRDWAPESEDELLPCDALAAELVGPVCIRQSKPKGVIRGDYCNDLCTDEAPSPSYYEEWQELFRLNRDSWMEGEELMQRSLADESASEEGNNFEKVEYRKPWDLSWLFDASLDSEDESHSSEPLLSDGDGDRAHEFWVEDRKSGEMECVDVVTKRSGKVLPVPLAYSAKRAKQ